MFETIKNAWKIPDLRKKLIYTLVMLIIFRLGSCIPVPLLEPEAMRQIFTSENSLFGFIDIISGGAFQNATIFAMSITPYINSSIIMQLLCVAIPALERLQKQGEDGRKKRNGSCDAATRGSTSRLRRLLRTCGRSYPKL